MKKLFFLPDAHWPYHDKQAWRLALKAARRFKPNILVNLGDCYDYNAVSLHPRTLRDADRLRFEEERKLCLQARADMEAVGARRNIFIEGNHENRLDRYLAKQAPILADSVSSTREFFGYDNGKWEYVSYQDHIKVGKLYITHDAGHAGKHAARQSQAVYGHNVVIGHTHRMDTTVVGNAIGVARIAASFGWLGDPAQVSYMHAIKVNREWSHGFGFGYMDTDGRVWLTSVPIIDGRCVVEGRVVR